MLDAENNQQEEYEHNSAIGIMQLLPILNKS